MEENRLTDPTPPENPVPSASPPSVDPEHIANLVQERVKAAMDASLRQAQESLSEPEPAPVQQDAFGNYVQPYIKPALDQANFASAAAIDFARFYGKHRVVGGDDADVEDGTISDAMEKQIETTFANMARQGRPASREEIYNYLVGQEITSKPQQFYEKQSKKREKALNRARGGVDIGASTSIANLSHSQLLGMSNDQLEKALGDMAF